MTSLDGVGEANDPALGKQTGRGLTSFGSLEKHQLHDRLHRLVLVMEKISRLRPMATI
jgi:hypothetical protein